MLLLTLVSLQSMNKPFVPSATTGKLVRRWKRILSGKDLVRVHATLPVVRRGQVSRQGHYL